MLFVQFRSQNFHSSLLSGQLFPHRGGVLLQLTYFGRKRIDRLLFVPHVGAQSRGASFFRERFGFELRPLAFDLRELPFHLRADGRFMLQLRGERLNLFVFRDHFTAEIGGLRRNLPADLLNLTFFFLQLSFQFLFFRSEMQFGVPEGERFFLLFFQKPPKMPFDRHIGNSGKTGDDQK